MVARGELWWLETPDEKGRPVLVISRDEAIGVLRRVMVAIFTELGAEHELAREHRRRLASALY